VSEITHAGAGAGAAIRQVFETLLARVEREQAVLDVLDAVAADGDHGATMVMGLRAVRDGFRATPSDDPSTILRQAALDFSGVGGSIGPLWGTALLRAAQALDGGPLDAHGARRMARAAVDGVRERGRAEVGDKTLLDVLAPAAEALDAALEAGEPLARALGFARDAAYEGLCRTAQLRPARGRASRLAERSIGRIDPGGASAFLAVDAVATAAGLGPDPRGLAANGPGGGSGRVKLLIDTDTGVDDAMAVVLGLLDPRVDVVAVTSVFGNVDVEKTTRNTAYILELLGREDVPLARGAAKGLLGTPQYAPFVHGEDGVGNAGFPEPALQPGSEHAAQLIIRMAREHPGELVLVPVGPLTNVALALALEPDLPRLVREVVWMGGVVATPGNVGPVAEADAVHDPEAAQMVFEAHWPVTMVGLDVTDTTLLTADDLARIEAADTPAARYLARITPFYMDFYSQRLGFRACAMHSALAVAVAADPSLIIASVEAPVAVELWGRHTRGMTVADRRARPDTGFTAIDSPRPARVVTGVDEARFKASFLDLVTRPTATGAPHDRGR
jgi:purine nucleosidase